jgi:limonene-1,2-epoxide hydrolase
MTTDQARRTDGAGAGEPKVLVGQFWEALYARDWPAVRSFFGPDSIYYDVPVGPASAARGPAGIEARLRLGLESLAGYEHGPAVIVAEGPTVMTEHAETWRWSSGETVTLPFVSVQRVEGGVITLWRDYWDLQTLMAGAPSGWQEQLASGDLSWVVDATDLV